MKKLLLALLVTAPLLADVVTTTDAANVFVAVPGCSDTESGATSASSSFSCDVGGFQFSGYAEGQTGLGPYGIGASMQTKASGDTSFITHPGYRAHSDVSVSWSQQFSIEGATGNGFVSGISVSGFPLGGVDPGLRMGLTLFDLSYDPAVFTPIPVTFGVPYDFAVSGTDNCNGFDYLGCETIAWYVSALTFSDAAGNPLPDACLATGVPEASSWILLATCMVLLLLRFTSARNCPPSRRRL
jgi:hypothetical protein